MTRADQLTLAGAWTLIVAAGAAELWKISRIPAKDAEPASQCERLRREMAAGPVDPIPADDSMAAEALGEIEIPRLASHHQTGVAITGGVVIGMYDGFLGPGTGSFQATFFVIDHSSGASPRAMPSFSGPRQTIEYSFWIAASGRTA